MTKCPEQHRRQQLDPSVPNLGPRTAAAWHESVLAVSHNVAGREMCRGEGLGFRSRDLQDFANVHKFCSR